MAVAYLHKNIILHSFISTRVIYVQNSELKLAGLCFAEKLDSKNDFSKNDRILEHDDCTDYPQIGLKYDI